MNGTCGDNLSWTFNSSTGKLTITGSGAMYDYDSMKQLRLFASYIPLDKSGQDFQPCPSPHHTDTHSDQL